jgi:hypothetical protein
MHLQSSGAAQRRNKGIASADLSCLGCLGIIDTSANVMDFDLFVCMASLGHSARQATIHQQQKSQHKQHRSPQTRTTSPSTLTNQSTTTWVNQAKQQ